jgi:hypothetical protein
VSLRYAELGPRFRGKVDRSKITTVLFEALHESASFREIAIDQNECDYEIVPVIESLSDLFDNVIKIGIYARNTKTDKTVYARHIDAKGLSQGHSISIINQIFRKSLGDIRASIYEDSSRKSYIASTYKKKLPERKKHKKDQPTVLQSPETPNAARKRKTEKVGATPPVSGLKEKLAVMDLKAKHGVKESLAEGLSVVIRDAIQNSEDYEVLSKDDVEVVAKRTAILQSLGCDDTQCLIDIGRSLGTKFMVAGAISKFGDTYNLSLRLINTMGKDAGVKKRVSKTCKCAEDELIGTSVRVAALLMGETGTQSASSSTKKYTTPKRAIGPPFHLRSQPRTLTINDVKTMLFKYNFYDKDFNEEGHFINDFLAHGDGTVTDRATGLMWLVEAPAIKVEYGEYWSIDDVLKFFNGNRFAGYSDWRIPTIEEIASILDPKGDALLIPSVFRSPQSRVYLSADTRMDTLRGFRTHWMVYFDRGIISSGNMWTAWRSHVLPVKVVRSGK